VELPICGVRLKIKMNEYWEMYSTFCWLPIFFFHISANILTHDNFCSRKSAWIQSYVSLFWFFGQIWINRFSLSLGQKFGSEDWLHFDYFSVFSNCFHYRVNGRWPAVVVKEISWMIHIVCHVRADSRGIAPHRIILLACCKNRSGGN
jgi:hypothetical protein